jgi:hypothetical protein
MATLAAAPARSFELTTLSGGGDVRIAILVNFVPRRHGSREAWLAAVAVEARRPSHAVIFYTCDPVHPTIQAAWHAEDAAWENLANLERYFVRGAGHVCGAA